MTTGYGNWCALSKLTNISIYHRFKSGLPHHATEGSEQGIEAKEREGVYWEKDADVVSIDIYYSRNSMRQHFRDLLSVFIHEIIVASEGYTSAKYKIFAFIWRSIQHFTLALLLPMWRDFIGFHNRGDPYQFHKHTYKCIFHTPRKNPNSKLTLNNVFNYVNGWYADCLNLMSNENSTWNEDELNWAAATKKKSA